MRPRTVIVPESLEPLFAAAERVVSAIFLQKRETPEHGTIEIAQDRYVLVRAASLSVEFFKLVRELFGEGREADADGFARNILFDLAHSVGRSDAHTFAQRTGASDPLARLSSGPVFFAHSGWAKVEISPDSRPAPDASYYLLYDHPYSFESDAWVRAGIRVDFPVCIMSSGYSSGWCSASFGIELVAAELTCRARGETACRFVMAPPDRIGEHAEGYFLAHGMGAEARGYEVPGLFARKHLEERLQRAHDALEGRIRERTAELELTNERLRLEMHARERAERQLRQSQKMEAIGRLAGGIAHDFNNILAIILGQTSILGAAAKREGGAPFASGLADITSAAEQARALTQQLLAVSRAQMQRKEAVDPNALLTQMRSLLEQLAPAPVRLELRLGLNVPPVLHDPSALQQVVMNLVVNARDAMPEGGRLLVATARVEVGEDEELEPGEYAELVVEDEGIGMDEDTRERIFEPFFTTKPSGQGTGLGLSTVYGIVAQAGGHVSLRSAPGQGTRFRVLLLAHEGTPARREPSAPESVRPPRPRGRVLLVEDNAMLRRVVRKMLVASGFEVSDAGDAAEALGIIARDGPPPLVVSDVLMPGQSGHVLARTLRAAHPEMAILLISGYAGVEELAAAGLEADERTGYLAKPFTTRELVLAIERLLPP